MELTIIDDYGQEKAVMTFKTGNYSNICGGRDN